MASIYRRKDSPSIWAKWKDAAGVEHRASLETADPEVARGRAAELERLDRSLPPSSGAAEGLTVDAQLRVTRANGRPIPNLYAVGEIIGGGATMGKAYTNGMMVTPALTFGRLLGSKILPVKKA